MKTAIYTTILIFLFLACFSAPHVKWQIYATAIAVWIVGKIVAASVYRNPFEK